MPTFKSFDKIEAWQNARKLAVEIYEITKRENFSKDFALRDQCRKACISVMSNISEGFERDGTNEFIQFLSIAKGSIGEIKSQLCIALDQGYIQNNTFNRILDLANETARMIAGLITYLRNSDLKGIKYKEQESLQT
jgi:four helix bundle protein